MLLPGFLENLDFEAEGFLELLTSLLQKAPDRVLELEAATGLVPEADQEILPKARDLLKRLESLRRSGSLQGVRVEFMEADWAFKPPAPACHLLADVSRRLPKKSFQSNAPSPRAPPLSRTFRCEPRTYEQNALPFMNSLKEL